MLVFELENDARIVLRPSGTEPKAKVYVETMIAAESPHEVEALRDQMAIESQRLAHAFCTEMLQRIGITLPAWALHISDLVSIEDKLRWSTQLVPQLLEKLNANPEHAVAWLHDQLGASNRALLRPGIEKLARDWDGNRALLLDCFQA